MEYMNALLIILGICFIGFSIIKYINIIKKLDFFYKITNISRKANIYIITLMISFLLFYLFIFDCILSGMNGNDEFTLATSFLLFLGGVFVYFIIFLLNKTCLSIESFNVELIKGLVGVFELRDKYTKGHSEHVAALVELIFNNLPENLKANIYKSELIMASLLHDIGKILVPENIINKTGPLTDQEYDKVKKHTADGCSILKSFENFKNIAPWIKYHHERIDGNGYHCLKGTEIPLESKIIAVADTYSALTTNRVYRKKMSPKKAIEVLESVSGTQLDSEIVEILVTIVKEQLNAPLKSNIYEIITGDDTTYNVKSSNV